MVHRGKLLVVLAQLYLAIGLPWQARAQTPTVPISLQFESVSSGTTTDSPTYVPDSGFERQLMLSFTGLPTTDGHLFTVMSYTSTAPVVLRGFSRTGTLNLLYNSDWNGIAWQMFKYQGGGMYLILSRLFTNNAVIGVRTIPLTVNGNLMTPTPASGNADTSKRIVLTADMPGTVYFFGLSLESLHKYDVTTVVSALNTVNLGGGANYPISLIYSESTDSVFAWWIGSSTLALFSSSNFGTSLASVVQNDYVFSIERAFHQVLLNNLNDTEIYELKSPEPASATSQLGKRITTSPTSLNLGAQVVTFTTFWAAMLVNFGPLNYLGIAPTGTDPFTATSVRGTLILASKSDLISTLVITLPPDIEFNMMRFTPNTAVTEIVQGTMRFYMGFYHNTNFNFQTYYFILDYCQSSGFTNCTTCPIGYWLADPLTYMTPSHCKLHADFPERNGMDNSTRTYKPCRLSTCTECRYDYNSCTRAT